MNFWKNHTTLRFVLIALFFVVGLVLTVVGWTMTGKLADTVAGTLQGQKDDGKATISAEDLKELQEVFHLFIFDILGIKDEAASAGGNNYEAFGKAIDLLLSIRQQAKANKDWATSDKIRNELTAFGFEIKDTKDGAEWKLSK